MMARDQVSLIVRQQPTRAQVVQENNPKNRKPIDPPPIIELKYDDRNDPSNSQWLVSPRTFMMVTLVDDKESKQETRNESPGKLLIGQTVSSLHRLKDVTNKGGLCADACPRETRHGVGGQYIWSLELDIG